jgi:ketosteroid isomerase-like protein
LLSHGRSAVTAEENVARVREAYAAYARGDTSALLELVDADLEWTYLDPATVNPEPQTCHGRGELRVALARQADRGLRMELEEIVGHDDKVLVVIHTPGVDAHRTTPADDRNYEVLTLRDGQIVGLRACRSKAEAMVVAGVTDSGTGSVESALGHNTP